MQRTSLPLGNGGFGHPVCLHRAVIEVETGTIAGQISKYFLFLIAVEFVFGLWGQRARTAGLHQL